MNEFLENRVKSLLLGDDKDDDEEMVVNQSRHNSKSEIRKNDIERDENDDFLGERQE